jgi:hypothetical protein
LLTGYHLTNYGSSRSSLPGRVNRIDAKKASEVA